MLFLVVIRHPNHKALETPSVAITLKFLIRIRPELKGKPHFFKKDCRTSVIDKTGQKAMKLVDREDKLRFNGFETNGKHLCIAVKPIIFHPIINEVL